jgi:hypothetical protein
MAETKIFPQFLFRGGGWDGGPQTWNLQGHLMDQITVPFFPHGNPSIHFLGNVLEYLFNSGVEIMKNGPSGADDII